MKEEMLKQLQGKWLSDGHYLTINGEKVSNGEDGRQLTWRGDINRWVIGGGFRISQLILNDDGTLTHFVVGNGPAPDESFIYTKVV